MESGTPPGPKRSAHAAAQAKYRLRNQDSEKEKTRLRMRKLREQRKLEKGSEPGMYQLRHSQTQTRLAKLSQDAFESAGMRRVAGFSHHRQLSITDCDCLAASLSSSTIVTVRYGAQTPQGDSPDSSLVSLSQHTPGTTTLELQERRWQAAFTGGIIDRSHGPQEHDRELRPHDVQVALSAR
ncbi:hypothetical protein C8R45DRAFT_1077318 [Mycena sanguinolenta]|nr:hypothetical protein C8R45DRAFT_1077318 [Mycena sanguinolenta]